MVQERQERPPFQAEERTVPIRRLTNTELDVLGFAGPLQLSRLQFGRLGYWRSSKWYCVETPRGKRMMTVTKKELAVYNIEP